MSPARRALDAASGGVWGDRATEEARAARGLRGPHACATRASARDARLPRTGPRGLSPARCATGEGARSLGAQKLNTGKKLEVTFFSGTGFVGARAYGRMREEVMDPVAGEKEEEGLKLNFGI